MTTQVKCQIIRCDAEATVQIVRERPVTTATRDRDYPWPTGRFVHIRCAKHAAEEVSYFPSYPDWRFLGDTVTFSPMPDNV